MSAFVMPKKSKQRRALVPRFKSDHNPRHAWRLGGATFAIEKAVTFGVQDFVYSHPETVSLVSLKGRDGSKVKNHLEEMIIFHP